PSWTSVARACTAAASTAGSSDGASVWSVVPPRSRYSAAAPSRTATYAPPARSGGTRAGAVAAANLRPLRPLEGPPIRLVASRPGQRGTERTGRVRGGGQVGNRPGRGIPTAPPGPRAVSGG